MTKGKKNWFHVQKRKMVTRKSKGPSGRVERAEEEPVLLSKLRRVEELGSRERRQRSTRKEPQDTDPKNSVREHQ